MKSFKKKNTTRKRKISKKNKIRSVKRTKKNNEQNCLISNDKIENYKKKLSEPKRFGSNPLLDTGDDKKEKEISSLNDDGKNKMHLDIFGK